MNKPKLTPAALRYWLIAYVSELVGVRPDHVDARRSLGEYGLDDRRSSELADRLEEVLRRPVSPEGLLAGESIAAVAASLVEPPRVDRLSLTVEALDALVAQLRA